jgi:hypothetical protein
MDVNIALFNRGVGAVAKPATAKNAARQVYRVAVGLLP